MRTAARRLLPLIPTLLVLGVAGCGGDDEQGGPSASPVDPGPEIQLAGRATTLELDLLTIGVMADNEVQLGAVRPAVAVSNRARFPITGGSVTQNTIVGTIDHAGALLLKKGERVVTVSGLVADTRSGQLLARVGARRIPLANLDVGLEKRAQRGATIVVTDIPATLTVAAADALNAGLGASVFVANLPLGIATIRATGAA
jgi:hypothetical protein